MQIMTPRSDRLSLLLSGKNAFCIFMQLEVITISMVWSTKALDQATATSHFTIGG